MTNDSTNRRENQPPNTPLIARFGGYLIALAFFALAAVLWFGSQDIDIPTAPTPKINKAAITPGAMREVMGDPPMTRIAGFDQKCSACHNLFESNWDGKRPLEQHKEIELRHGSNNKCSNCHSGPHREKLALYDGTEIPFAEVEKQCASCHGLVARDWERGAHGKTLGSWDPENPAYNRLTCTACHDPHHPAFKPIEPMPGPRTLRMGDPSSHEAPPHKESKDPLRRALENHAENGHGGSDHGEDHEGGDE